MPQALVSLGSNLGDRHLTLDRAVAELESSGECRVLARSSWYETAPVGGPPGQEPFANGAVRLETSLEPPALLARLQSIEAEAGRERSVEWGPRTLDLDLLFYDERVLDTPQLKLPHPRAAFRRFVLVGAAAVAPDWRHPVLDRTLVDLLRHLDTAPRYVALVGANSGFRSQLAAEAAHVAGARLVEPTRAALPASVDDVVCDGPDPTRPIEFVRGRVEALEASLAAGDDWFIDDAWLVAEAVELVGRLPAEHRPEFVAACGEAWSKLPPPRLVASIDASPASAPAAARHQGALAVRNASPWPQALPPVVDLAIADRERALEELAAAMVAAG
jgi:2-amino-4-hydroxy-6-hydroxymethyldihydropteridine diphosphokinase